MQTKSHFSLPLATMGDDDVLTNDPFLLHPLLVGRQHVVTVPARPIAVPRLPFLKWHYRPELPRLVWTTSSVLVVLYAVLCSDPSVPERLQDIFQAAFRLSEGHCKCSSDRGGRASVEDAESKFDGPTIHADLDELGDVLNGHTFAVQTHALCEKAEGTTYVGVQGDVSSFEPLGELCDGLLVVEVIPVEQELA